MVSVVHVLCESGKCITSSLHSQASGQNGVAQGRRKRRRKTVEKEKTLSSEEKEKGVDEEEGEVEEVKGERRGGGGSITALACLKPRTNNIKQESEIVE